MCSCHSIPECCVMFSGVKLSKGIVCFISVLKSFSSKFYLLRRISFLLIAADEEIYVKTILLSVVYGMTMEWNSL